MKKNKDMVKLLGLDRLPKNATATNCLRQQQMHSFVREWENHATGCECKSCCWVSTQMLIFKVK